MSVFVRVALDHPLPTLFDYRYDLAAIPLPGMLVRIPFGRRDAVGLICEVTDHTDVPPDKLRDVAAICSTLAPLADEWRALTLFAAEYYQRGLGEVALPALPQVLRDASRWAKLLAPEERYRLMPEGRASLPDALPPRATALRRLADALAANPTLPAVEARALHPKARATLDEWQTRGWVALETGDVPEQDMTPARDGKGRAARARRAFAAVDRRAIRRRRGDNRRGRFRRVPAARRDRERQNRGLSPRPGRFARFAPRRASPVLVPEINLTPQFEAAFRTRFAALPEGAIVTMHSGLAEGERARNWLAAHTGRARLVLGTRLAILASLPKLALIVVDEEHDPAYKQQEGLRYSARDLRGLSGEQTGNSGGARVGDAIAGKLVASRAGPIHQAHAHAPSRGDGGFAERPADRPGRGAAARTGVGGRIVGTADRRDENAARTRRAKPRVPQPARLRPHPFV